MSGYSRFIPLADALRALGAELRANRDQARVIVVGGASLVLRGVVARPTGDVDVIATMQEDTLVFPHPLDDRLQTAAAAVARNLGLPGDWLNAMVARNWGHRWPEGLPPDLLADVEWRRYGGLEIGLAGRRILIPLKLHALVDRSRVRLDDAMHVVEVDVSPAEAQKHLGDLRALAPSSAELEQAIAWVKAQDTSPYFGAILHAVLDQVRNAGD